MLYYLTFIRTRGGYTHWIRDLAVNGKVKKDVLFEKATKTFGDVFYVDKLIEKLNMKEVIIFGKDYCEIVDFHEILSEKK